MIGKIAYSRDTGNPIGTVQEDHGSTWYIQLKDGNAQEFMKDIVTFDESLASEIRRNPEIFKKSAIVLNTASKIPHHPNGILISINQFVGFLSIVGGIAGIFALWPDSVSLSAGYGYKFLAYLPAISVFAGGFISGLVLFNFAALLRGKIN